MREKAAKGEVNQNEVIEAHYGVAKELLEAGKDQESFFMLTSTMQLEAAYIGSATVRQMHEVEEGFNHTGARFGAAVEDLGDSAKKINNGAEILIEAGNKIYIATDVMSTTADKLGGIAGSMDETGNLMNRASIGMQEAAERMPRSY